MEVGGRLEFQKRWGFLAEGELGLGGRFGGWGGDGVEGIRPGKAWAVIPSLVLLMVVVEAAFIDACNMRIFKIIYL